MELLAFGDTGWGDELFYATLMTIAVSITAMFIGFLFALIFTPLKLSNNKFLNFIEDSPIIAHNANFDVGFLNYELEKISKPQISKDRIVDTVVIARNRFPGQQVNLDALVKKLKVNSLVDREFHGALKDAKILTDVYLELQGINQMGLELNERNAEDLKLSGELNLKPIVLTKDETEAHKEFIKNNIPNSNWAKIDKNYE